MKTLHYRGTLSNGTAGTPHHAPRRRAQQWRILVMLLIGCLPFAPQVALATNLATCPSNGVHIVQSGETLSSIANQYGVSQDGLAAANAISDPNLIYVGEQLVIPGCGGSVASAPATSAGQTIHIVEPGETLSSIAGIYGVSQDAIAAANGITDPNVIYVGQRLVIHPAMPQQRPSRQRRSRHQQWAAERSGSRST